MYMHAVWIGKNEIIEIICKDMETM